MTPFQHRFVLPPIILALHGVFLLPLLVPTASNDHGSSIPSLLHAKYSIPFGILGFVVVFAAKQLAVKIPLPKDPRRKQLAAYLEWTVLFLLGTLEEIWRWGLVRILVGLEGGDGGYGRDSFHGSMRVKEGREEETGMRKYSVDVLWQGVYFMCWIWSLVESGFAWWTYAPHPETERTHHHHHRRGRSFRNRGDRSPEDSPGNSGYPRSREGLRASPSTTLPATATPSFRQPMWNDVDARRKNSKISLFTQDPPRPEFHVPATEEVRQSYGNAFTFGNRFNFQQRASYIENRSSPPSPTARNFHQDLERGEGSEDGQHSDNNFGDDEDDLCSSESESDSSSIRSSSEITRSRAETPLLSSSLPYDHMSDHPHHEQQSLLQHQYRRMSYNTLTGPPAGRRDSSNDEAAHDVHIIVRNVDETSNTPKPVVQTPPPRTRAYPTYPSYSASFNHTYFSSQPNLPAGSSSNLLPCGSPQCPASPTCNSFSPQQTQSSQQLPPPKPTPATLPTYRYLEMIFGVDTNSLPIYMPLLWRLSAICHALGHALIYAWFPNLVYRGQFQSWTFIMLVLLASKKGWHTMEWVGGEVARSGVLKVTVFTTLLSLATYVVGVEFWGLFH